MSPERALDFAQHHIETWNRHDLEAIVALYAPDVVLSSPLAGQLVGGPVVRGRAELRRYFELGLAKYPDLRFELLDVLLGVETLTLFFLGAGGAPVADVLRLNGKGEIVQVVAHQSCTRRRR